MSNETELRKNRMIKGILLAISALFLWSVLLLWSWNSTASELFGLQTIQFKHAFMITANIAVIVFVLNIGRRRANNLTH